MLSYLLVASVFHPGENTVRNMQMMPDHHVRLADAVQPAKGLDHCVVVPGGTSDDPPRTVEVQVEARTGDVDVQDAHIEIRGFGVPLVLDALSLGWVSAGPNGDDIEARLAENGGQVAMVLVSKVYSGSWLQNERERCTYSCVQGEPTITRTRFPSLWYCSTSSTMRRYKGDSQSENHTISGRPDGARQSGLFTSVV